MVLAELVTALPLHGDLGIASAEPAFEAENHYVIESYNFI